MLPASCLRAVLRPLVRLFVSHSHSIQEFVAIAKTLYVEAAEEELKRVGERSSMSRLSAVTGLNRRDISHIQGAAGAPLHQGASILARVLSNWENLPRFRGRGATPKPLTCDGESSQFFDLVRSVSRDIHPSAILIELRRAGLVRSQENCVELIESEAYAPQDLERGFSIIARDIATLLELGNENVVAPKTVRNLHLRTEFDNIDPAQIKPLKAWLLQEGKEFHRRARELFAKHDLDLSSDSTGSAKGGRVILTSFGAAFEAPDKIARKS